MYIPDALAMQPNKVASFIAQYSFATVISADLQATHIPLIYCPDQGEHGTLFGHVAKANKHWQQFDQQGVLAIFTGPHGYISPTWYQAVPAVPTWNYAAVHCYGQASILPEQQLPWLLEQMMQQYQPDIMHNTELMPEAYVAKLQQAIVGFSIEVSEIQAKEKLGQHRKPADQELVYQTLKSNSSLDSQALANYMTIHQVGIGSVTVKDS